VHHLSDVTTKKLPLYTLGEISSVYTPYMYVLCSIVNYIHRLVMGYIYTLCLTNYEQNSWHKLRAFQAPWLGACPPYLPARWTVLSQWCQYYFCVNHSESSYDSDRTSFQMTVQHRNIAICWLIPTDCDGISNENNHSSIHRLSSWTL